MWTHFPGNKKTHRENERNFSIKCKILSNYDISQNVHRSPQGVSSSLTVRNMTPLTEKCLVTVVHIELLITFYQHPATTHQLRQPGHRQRMVTNVSKSTYYKSEFLKIDFTKSFEVMKHKQTISLTIISA